MPRLELLHRRDDGGIVFARHALADEVARNFEPPLQDVRCPGRVEPGFMTVAGTIGQPPCATIALIVLDRGLGRRDVARWRASACRAPDW